MSLRTEYVLQQSKELFRELQLNPEAFAGYNQLLTLFFKGLPLSILQELLRSPHKRVLKGALFIAEELGASANDVLPDIVRAAASAHPEIRAAAYAAICMTISKNDQGEFCYVIVGLVDPDPQCRKMAMLWAMRIENARLKAALEAMEQSGMEPSIQVGLRWLLAESAQNPTQIMTWINKADPLLRRFGAVAAGRVASAHPQLLEIASHLDYQDIKEAASAQIRFLKIRRGR